MRIFLFTGVALGFSAASAYAQFPDLPGKELALKTCGQCHEADRASSLRQSKDAWDSTMAGMVGRGMDISDDTYAAVLDYLSKAFPAPPPKPLNINTAEAIEIESALSLLRSQAALIIAWRDKHGKFQSLDDLKKITGLDFAKVEAKKERIVF